MSSLTSHNSVVSDTNAVQEFWDDGLMIRILEETPPWKRKNLELVCRRMYQLSLQTSYKKIEKLHLFFEGFISSDFKAGTLKIFLKAYNSSNNQYEKVKNSTVYCHPQDFDFVEKYLQKYRTSITKVTVNCLLTAEFFHIFDLYLKKVDELNCRGFNEGTLDYFYTSGQTFTSRITTLRLSWMIIPEQSDVLTPFLNLEKLYIEEYGCSRNLLCSLVNRQSNLQLISLKEERYSEDLKDEWNQYGNHILNELGHYSENIEFINTLKFSTSPFHLNLSLTIQNLTSFEVSLAQFDYRQIGELLQSICFMDLVKLVLKDAHFSQTTFDFRAEFNSKSTLKELTLENWTSLDQSHMPLQIFLKSSLKKMRICQIDIHWKFFKYFPLSKLCPGLEEIECNLSSHKDVYIDF